MAILMLLVQTIAQVATAVGVCTLAGIAFVESIRR